MTAREFFKQRYGVWPEDYGYDVIQDAAKGQVEFAEAYVSSKAVEAPGGQACDCVIEVDSSGKATVIHQAGCRYSKLYEAFRRACEQVWRCTDAPGQTLESTMQFYLAAPVAPSERADAEIPWDKLKPLMNVVCDGYGISHYPEEAPGDFDFCEGSVAWLAVEAYRIGRAGLSSQEGK